MFLPFAAGGDDVGGAVAFPLNICASVGRPVDEPALADEPALVAADELGDAVPDELPDPLLQAASKIIGTATPTANGVRRRSPNRAMKPPGGQLKVF